MSKWSISRRTVLRGIGATVALPLLDSMTTGEAMGAAAPAASAGKGGAAAAALAGKPPVRMCAVFMPNGVNFREWSPDGVGTDYKMSKTLAPLEKVRGDINILSGLTLDNARAKGDGPGDHARSAAAVLTGARRDLATARQLLESVETFVAEPEVEESTDDQPVTDEETLTEQWDA